MWLFSCAQSSLKQLDYNMANIEKKFCLINSFHYSSYLVIIGILFMPQNINAFVTNNQTTNRLYMPIHYYKGSKYTIDDLLNGKFSFKVSDDIDMDPCKASK